MGIKSLFERKYVEVYIPGRCVHVVKRIPNKMVNKIKMQLIEESSASGSNSNVRIVVKNIFGKIVRYE